MPSRTTSTSPLADSAPATAQAGLLPLDSEVSWAYFLIVPVFLYVLLSAVGANEKVAKASGQLFCRIMGLACVDLVIFFGESHFPSLLPQGYVWPEAMIAMCIVIWIAINFFCASRNNAQANLSNFGYAIGKSNDVYSDLTCPVQTSALIFAVQCVLMQFYANAAVNRMTTLLKPHEVLHGHTWQCFSASFVIQLMIVTNATESYPISTWRLLRETKGRIRVPADQKSGAQNEQRTAETKAGLTEVWVRMAMSFMVKMVYAKFIALTLPIVLSDAATSLDFLKEAVIVSFITTLDKKEPIKFEIAMARQVTESDAELAFSRSSQGVSLAGLTLKTSNPPGFDA